MRFGSLAPYIPWHSRPHPLDWKAEFDREAPLNVEIGFGNGEHLVRCAQEDPGSNYVGLEIAWGSVWRALRTTHRLKLENVRVLLGDANASILWNFPERSVDNFTALFPCPWPKRRHARFRLFQPKFLRLCNSRLKQGGSLTVVTDAADYRDQMLKQITRANTGMETTCETIPASFDTKYERKWQDGGQNEFYRLVFRKIEHQSQPNPELPELNPHIVTSFDPETFAPQDEHSPTKISFKDFLYDPQRERAMQEVFVTDDSLPQQFWISIKKHNRGWRIAHAAGPNLLPLPSVQRALDLVRDACQAKSGD